MDYQLTWSPSARFDLKDIAGFIAEDSPSAAERFVKRLFQAVERLPHFPESGRVVSEFDDPTVREIVGSHAGSSTELTAKDVLSRS